MTKDNISSTFTNLFPISKTIRNELRPIGKTLEYIQKEGILTEDQARAEAYKQVKKLVDGYHRDYIENALSKVNLEWTDIIQAVFDYRKSMNDENKKNLAGLQREKRIAITKIITDDSSFRKMFGKEMYEELLPQYIKTLTDVTEEKRTEQLAYVRMFNKFSTYFVNFNENRKNIYSSEEKSGAISFRIVHQNLMFFVDNMAAYQIICGNLEELMQIIEKEQEAILDSWTLEQIFNADFFNYVLSQKGINFYNEIIGVINKYGNIYCQQHDEVAKYAKSIRMKPLFKQILSISESRFQIPDKLQSDEEVKELVLEYVNTLFNEDIINRIKVLAGSVIDMDLSKIYIKASEATRVSKELYQEWNILDEALKLYLENQIKSKSKSRIKKSQGESQYSVLQWQDMVNDYYQEIGVKQSVQIVDYFKSIYNLAELLKKKQQNWNTCVFEKMKENAETAYDVKERLDKYMDMLHMLKPFHVENELDKNTEFYAEYDVIFETWFSIVKIYNMVRNYATMKPYSDEKVKLNFKNPTLANGWDKNKEQANTAVIFLKEDKYYLGIMNAKDKPEFVSSECADRAYKKMVYKLLPGPNKMLPKVFFSKKGIENFNPPKEILDGYNQGKHRKGDTFDKQFCMNLIDWFKDAIERHEDWREFDFNFSKTESYSDISGFYREVEQQGYKITYEYIKESDVEEMVDAGKLYLFQIYNKDFAPGKTGKDDLHTMYLKALFDEENLKDVVFKLNGEAELFYRKGSVKKPYVHKTGSILINKWTNEEIARPIPDAIYKELDAYYNNGLQELTDDVKKYLPLVTTKVATHDITKDKRYTVDKFTLHLPMTINFKSKNITNINNLVCKYLKETTGVKFIGIDRGERNLLYVTLIDEDGTILQQKNFNVIEKYDYKAKLELREKERGDARKNWAEIGKITDLKEGYLSQAINEIVNMMLENNAVIIMEDLNYGFKRGRFKVERQVYQKFETMLINKLNYIVKKSSDINAPSGLLHGLQLSNRIDSLKDVGKQCGFIFYIPAAFTSKIDPTTGFVSVFDYKKISSPDRICEFFLKFETIFYDATEDVFSFTFDYRKFEHYQTMSQNEWTVNSNGKRIRTYKDLKTGTYVCEEVCLTDKLKEIFSGTQYKENSDLRQQISCMDNDKLKELFVLFKLILQMRNSKSGTEIDYILSPVKNHIGKYYDSRDYITEDGTGILPENADANGAYHIVLKGKLLIDSIREIADENGDFNRKELKLSHEMWFAYMQNQEYKK